MQIAGVSFDIHVLQFPGLFHTQRSTRTDTSQSARKASRSGVQQRITSHVLTNGTRNISSSVSSIRSRHSTSFARGKHFECGAKPSSGRSSAKRGHSSMKTYFLPIQNSIKRCSKFDANIVISYCSNSPISRCSRIGISSILSKVKWHSLRRLEICFTRFAWGRLRNCSMHVMEQCRWKVTHRKMKFWTANRWRSWKSKSASPCVQASETSALD